LVYDRYDLSMQVLMDIYEKFNESFLVNLTVGYLNVLERNMDIALEWFDKAVSNSIEFPFIHNSTRYLIADILYLRCEWEKTIELITECLEATNTPFIRCSGYYKISFSKWMLNQKETVRETLMLSKENVKPHFDHDTYASYMTDKFILNNGFTKFDEIKVQLENLLLAKEYERASQLLVQLQEYIAAGKFEGENSVLCEIWESYFRGLIFSGRGEYEEALNIFRDEVISKENILKPNPLMFYIIPYSQVEVGEILSKLDRKNEAKTFFLKAKTYNNFLFHKYLLHRIVRPLESMKNNLGK